VRLAVEEHALGVSHDPISGSLGGFDGATAGSVAALEQAGQDGSVGHRDGLARDALVDLTVVGDARRARHRLDSDDRYRRRPGAEHAHVERRPEAGRP